MTKASQSQVRDINRTLFATVRADWRFPDSRPSRASVGVTSLEPLSYRERYYSTSDDDGEDDSTTDTEEEEESEGDETEEASWSSPETELEINPLDEATTRKDKKKKKRKFNCPDDVAAYLNRKLESRKRRKMRTLAEEMSWNEGLCFFLRRRNAWTGALTQAEVKTKEHAKSQKSNEEEKADDASQSSRTHSREEGESSNATSDADSGIAVSLSSPLTTTTTPTSASPFDPPAEASSLVNVLVPISIPLLPPSHPVRTSIMARTHSELYEKIVRDSRTPAVPLNLAHMMRVIVQGWKDEGNWPPKSTMVEAGIASKKKLKAAQVKVATEQKGVGLFVGHKHLQRGVDSVKRALRLSGSAPPAGD